MLAQSWTTQPKMPSLQPDPQFVPPTSRRGLRDIVSGYRIDRWPIKIDIAPAETPESWLRRVSDRYQLTPRQLCDALGIKLAGHPKIAAVLRQYSDSVEAALDIRVDDLTTAGDVHFRSLWLASFVASGHRFCPSCLEDDGYWRASWRSPLSVVCPHHRILYIDRCPDCGEQPWRTDAWLGQCAPVHVCAARVPSEAGPERKVGRWCGADLREAPRIPAPETALQAQAILAGNEHHLAPISLPSVAHRFGIGAGESREVLATLIGAAWTRTQPEQLTTNRKVQALHTGLVAYQEITTTNRPTPHLDQLSDTMSLDRILLGGNDNVGLYGPVITAWYIDRIREHLSPRKQLGWRTGRTWPSLPADPTTPWASTDARLPEHRQQPACASAAWVPQLLDTDTLYLPWEPDPAGRALAAMCLLNLGRGIKMGIHRVRTRAACAPPTYRRPAAQQLTAARMAAICVIAGGHIHPTLPFAANDQLPVTPDYRCGTAPRPPLYSTTDELPASGHSAGIDSGGVGGIYRWRH